MDNGQKYSHTSNFPYLFQLSQFMSDFDHYFINKSRKICSL